MGEFYLVRTPILFPDPTLQVHQERILSPRMLHFAGEEMILECKRDVHCDCGEMSIAEFGLTDVIPDCDDLSTGDLAVKRRAKSLDYW